MQRAKRLDRRADQLLDLGGVRANRVSFVSTHVESLDLTRATLRNFDLRGVSLRTINGIEGLKGATLNSMQITEFAPLFARQFGITVED